jgi:seryl-tRNA synthetase
MSTSAERKVAQILRRLAELGQERRSYLTRAENIQEERSALRTALLVKCRNCSVYYEQGPCKGRHLKKYEIDDDQLAEKAADVQEQIEDVEDQMDDLDEELEELGHKHSWRARQTR